MNESAQSTTAEKGAQAAFVYLVQTQAGYERPTIVEAYLCEKAAAARVELLNELARRVPTYPGSDCSDEEYDTWHDALEAWKKSHPLGPEPPGYVDDGYEMEKVPLVANADQPAASGARESDR